MRLLLCATEACLTSVRKIARHSLGKHQNAMAARFEEDASATFETTECENCGATSNLLRCSRCHSAWFCSLKCHKAYWPFHKAACRRNDFADAVEQQEPRFAAWMRSHGKLAVLQDDEVDRLERSSEPGGWRGLGREDVLDSLWGRVDPRPAAPSYEPPSKRQEPAPGSVLGAASTADERAWQEVQVPEGLGLAFTHFKWRQNLSHVLLFVRLPGKPRKSQVAVRFTPATLEVVVAGHPLLTGRLSAEIKVEGSTWWREDNILHVVLLKRNRKGHYADGSTAADTFWFSLMAAGQGADRLQLQHPPTAYYSSPYEADDLPASG